MIDPDAALAYLRFVVARHKVWEARQRGLPQPWTDEPLVASRKFTNVFRVLDTGSQFVVRELLEPGLEPRDVLARAFLYRYTNLPATWIHVQQSFGRYPLAEDMGDDLISCIQSRRDAGHKVFSGAYVILPQPNRAGDKVAQAVNLARQLFHPDSPDDIMPAFLDCEFQPERFAVLRHHYGVGDFMAMQVLTDWGYSPQCGQDLEDEFVMPGPGCRKGAAALAPGMPARDVIDWCRAAVLADPDCPVVEPHDYALRPPSIMDIQNTLCEFSKYVRFEGRPTKAVPYRPVHPGPQAAPVLPQHWR